MIYITVSNQSDQIKNHKLYFWFDQGKTSGNQQVQFSSSSNSVDNQQHEDLPQQKHIYNFFLKAMRQDNDNVPSLLQLLIYQIPKIIKDIHKDSFLLTATLNSFNWQILHVACHKGNVSLVEWLLKQKQIQISAKTTSGYTAKELAQRKGFTNIVQLFENIRIKWELEIVPSVPEVSEN